MEIPVTIHLNFRGQSHLSAASWIHDGTSWTENRLMRSTVSTGVPNGPSQGQSTLGTFLRGTSTSWGATRGKGRAFTPQHVGRDVHSHLDTFTPQHIHTWAASQGAEWPTAT